MKVRVRVKTNEGKTFDEYKADILGIIKNASEFQSEKERSYVFALLFAYANICYRKQRILSEIKNGNKEVSVSNFIKNAKDIFSSVSEEKKDILGFAFMDAWLVGLLDINYPEQIVKAINGNAAYYEYADDYAALMILNKVVADIIKEHSVKTSHAAWLIKEKTDAIEKKESSLFVGTIYPNENDFSSRKEYDSFNENEQTYYMLKDIAKKTQREKKVGQDLYDLQDFKCSTDDILARTRINCVSAMTTALYGRNMFFAQEGKKKYSFC